MYKGINDFKTGYQPRTNIAQDEKGDMVTDYHSIMVRYRDHISQLLNVHGVNVRKTEIKSVGPLVPKPSPLEVETAIGKLKRHKLPGIDQIRAKLIKARGRTIRSEIH